LKTIIHSTKHIVQTPFSTITTGTAENILLVRAMESTASNLSNEVVEGSVIKAVFVEMWVQNSANDGHQIAILEKVPQDVAGATFANMGNLYTYINKKNILFTHEGLSSNDGVGNPLPIIRQWFKIPKGKQRFGLGDRLVLTISNPSSNTLNRCGVTIYKELD